MIIVRYLNKNHNASFYDAMNTNASKYYLRFNLSFEGTQEFQVVE